MAVVTNSLLLFLKPHPPAPKSRIFLSSPILLQHLALVPSHPPIRFHTTRRYLPFLPCSVVQNMPVEEEKNDAKEEEKDEGQVMVEEEEEEEEEKRRKLYVVNLPWNYSAPEMFKLFSQCGNVKDVEIIKHKDGKSRGFAFVTMASGEEARAVVQKFDAYEVMGRIIRVEFSKSFRKPAPPPSPGATTKETRYKIYAGNLAWKVRSTHLKDFFSDKFNPVSARVVFDSPSGRSSGYGFVGFTTLEEAEAAVKELDGKELMGRPVRLKISQRTSYESDSEPEEAEPTEKQSGES